MSLHETCVEDDTDEEFRSGSYKNILGVFVSIENHRREIIRANHPTAQLPETETKHDVLKVALRPGDKNYVYVLDVKSAQYGLYQPVVAWDQFEKD